MEKSHQTLVKLTGLWLKEGKNGMFYQGQLSPWANILIFRNQYKESEQDPDLILYISHANLPDQPRKENRRVEPL